MNVEREIRESAALLEVSTADEVIERLRDGDVVGALDFIEESAEVHALCGNTLKADRLGEIAGGVRDLYHFYD